MAAPPPPSGYGYPAPGYGYYSPQPPPGWQPPPRQPGVASLATAILCGIFAVPALLVTLRTARNAALCNSGIGQLGQAFDQTAARDCAAVNGAHILAIVAFVALAGGCLIATLVHVAGRRPSVAPAWPGPVPPPYWQGPVPQGFPPQGYPPQGQPATPPAPPSPSVGPPPLGSPAAPPPPDYR
jgi:hypothetical protein